MDKIKNTVGNKFDILLQSAIVKLPRAVPTAVLKYTSPLGPHPFILDLPSRDYDETKRTIPVFVFLPPLSEDDPYKPGSSAANSTASLSSQMSKTSLNSAGSQESKTSVQSKDSETKRKWYRRSKSSQNTKENNPTPEPASVPAVDEPTPTPAPTGSKEVAVRQLPVLIDFHGGGFFMGSPLEQAPFCAQMARNMGCIVISVDYRMGPIDKFPGAITDAEDILNHVLRPQRRPKMPKSASSYTGSWKSNTENKEPPSGPGIIDLENTISYRINEAQFKNRKGGQTPQPIKVKLDRNRVAVCGFSSGGNLALNLALDVPSGTPHIPEGEKPWLCPFSALGPQRPNLTTAASTSRVDKSHLTAAGSETLQTERPDATDPTGAQPTDPTLLSPNTALQQPAPANNAKPQIPLLLFYPSLDLRLLPSERSRPEALGPHPEKGPSWWTRVNDSLAPSYCPKELTTHFRASPGLASPAKDIHPDAKMLLVLCAKDTLFEQSETWVEKVIAEGRGKDLRVERYKENHGWTQIPTTWLSLEEKRTRAEVFAKTEAFLRASWAGEDPVKSVEREEKELMAKTLSGEDIRAEAAAKAAGGAWRDTAT